MKYGESSKAGGVNGIKGWSLFVFAKGSPLGLTPLSLAAKKVLCHKIMEYPEL